MDKAELWVSETRFHSVHQSSPELTMLLQPSEWSNYGCVAPDLARKALLSPVAKMRVSGSSEGSRDCMPGSAPGPEEVLC